MLRQLIRIVWLAMITGVIISCTSAKPAATVVTGAGDIKAKVEEFKQLLGGSDNGGEPGAKPSGYRTITWDSLADDLAAPKDYAPDFFNATVSPRARGMVLATSGSGLFVSAKAGNPANTAPRFGNVNPKYADIFKTYSPERLFSPMGSNVITVTFFIPGTKTPASVRGFGAVFADVDTDRTSIEYRDAGGNVLGKYTPPVANNGLSFLGVAFLSPVVRQVRITFGNAPLGGDDSEANDVVVADDFIFGEPQAAP